MVMLTGLQSLEGDLLFGSAASPLMQTVEDLALDIHLDVGVATAEAIEADLDINTDTDIDIEVHVGIARYIDTDIDII